MPLIYVLISLLSLTACSTKNNLKPFTPLPLEQQQTALYVYRPPAMGNSIYSPDLYIDDEHKLVIKNGKLARLTLPAGSHQLTLDAENNQGKLTRLILDLATGNTRYVRVTTSLKIKSASTYEPYQRSYNMEEVGAEQAIDEISACCNTRDEQKAEKTTREPQATEPKPGFSVDKTQNPFSH